MTTADLGKQVKRLHPGAYDSVDDSRLGRAMQSRYPGLYDHFTDTPSQLDTNTLPETPGTLRIQLEQLADGKRRCVFVARGSRVKIDGKQYGAMKQVTPAGEFYFNPKLISRRDITSALKEHRLNEILGDASTGYGAPSKEDMRGPVEAVVARDAQGETAHSALTDQPHVETAVQSAQKLTPPGGSVSVESPDKEIAHRSTKFKRPPGRKWPPPPTPTRS